MRRPALLLVGLVAAAAFSPAAAQAETSPEAQFVQLINQARTQRGLRPLRMRADLNGVAERHAVRMMNAGDIWHNSKLASQIPGTWRYAGENVGVGFDVSGLHDAFMASRDHRVNILRAGFDDIGLGVVTNADGEVYVTQVFVDRVVRLTTVTSNPPAPVSTPKTPSVASDDSEPSLPAVRPAHRAPFKVASRKRVDRRNAVELLIRIVSTN